MQCRFQVPFLEASTGFAAEKAALNDDPGNVEQGHCSLRDQPADQVGPAAAPQQGQDDDHILSQDDKEGIVMGVGSRQGDKDIGYVGPGWPRDSFKVLSLWQCARGPVDGGGCQQGYQAVHPGFLRVVDQGWRDSRQERCQSPCQPAEYTPAQHIDHRDRQGTDKGRKQAHNQRR